MFVLEYRIIYRYVNLCNPFYNKICKYKKYSEVYTL